MSSGPCCKCKESKKPIAERDWTVVQHRCNHSAFNGYHWTASDYSTIICNNPDCYGAWRTKAAYVDDLVREGKCKE